MPRNARDWPGSGEHDDDVPVDEDTSAYEDVQDAAGNGIQIAILHPRNFRDAVTIGEYYRQGIPVIINLEDMDNALATRIIDFASGLILGLHGDVERPSRRTFLIVPSGTTIHTTHNGLTEEGFFNQALRPASAPCALASSPAPYHRRSGHDLGLCRCLIEHYRDGGP